MYYSNKIARHFSKALKSEYIIDSEKLVFKHITKDSVNVYYDNELILGFQFNLILGPGNMDDIISLKIENYENSRVKMSMNELSVFNEHDEVFEEVVRDMLRVLDLNISKKTVAINNAQEIIEITRKAKEDNIKKDIEDIESKILDYARDGEDSLFYYLSELKTNFYLMHQSDNEIINHFRNKGFSCSVKDGLGGWMLRISWGD